MKTQVLNPLGLAFVALGSVVVAVAILGRPEIGAMNNRYLDEKLRQIGKRLACAVAGVLFVAVGIAIMLGYL